MGIDHTWSDADYTRIDTEINKWASGNFFNVSTEIGHKRQWWLSLNNSRWKAKLETYLEKWNHKFTVTDPSATWFDKYFKDWNDQTQAAKNRLALHEAMWGDTHASKYKGTAKGKISYDELLANVYTNKNSSSNTDWAEQTDTDAAAK
jgi:hypothetical protein